MLLRFGRLGVLLLVVLSSFAAIADSSPSEPLKYLPVQDGGRLKPFDSFAREMLFLVHNKETLEGKPAQEIVFTWLLQPTAWQSKEFISIKSKELKQSLKLEEARNLFSPAEILSNPRLSLVMQELTSKRETQEKLDPYFQSVQRLESQLGAFSGVASGRLIRLLPATDGTDNWISVDQFEADGQEAFVPISEAFLEVLKTYSAGSDPSAAREQMQKAVDGFKDFARARAPEAYPTDTKIAIEVHYITFNPYNWAGLAYFLAAMLMIVAWFTGKSWLTFSAWLMMFVGLGLHTYGFGLRVYLTGRPPVSNMYETVVLVAWGAVFFAMIIEAVYRLRLVFISGALVAAFCLIIAESAPRILDPSLQPLEPVLRSQFWLIVHVITITISYSAFFLAFALGDLGLFYAIRGERQGSPKLRAVSTGIYRSIQIGVVLLTAGIILGGIWADYSWGRFWGWDPKETWALIALLGYLAVLHGRLAGWLRDIGLSAGAIVAFSLVIMAWYGVNFVLGAGLHSYGFGAGGVEYVAGFVVLHFLYVLFALLVARNPAR